MSRRATAFVAVLAGCLLLGGGWVLAAALRTNSTTSRARVSIPDASASTRGPDARGELLVRAVDPHDPRLNGSVERVSLDEERQSVRADGLACARVHYAGGRGLCLALAPSGVDYRGLIFARGFEVRRSFALEGIPSRVRVSPSGRWGAYTTFVSGHSYARPGGFSTLTRIVDMRTGRQLGDLEQFEVFRAGRRIDSPDFNFWGVTFARGDDRFYATLATGGERYLVAGSLRARRVRLLRANMECPSLSPDETRLAYKRRVGDPSDWRLHVLDLRSMRDVPLAERRSIDDQVEWLDNDTILYGDSRDVWAADASGAGRPQRLLRRAASPVRLSTP